nr:reverse transcriptase domain-containing protein [Tanacetum cinerariifolium]
MPNLKSSILYPSRHDNERRRDQANEKIEKFYEIFKDMSFEVSFDALILMPKFASTLKALIGNKEKLSEMARTLMNEHCSMVILNKLPRKLEDPGKFLIPCDFLELVDCLALADLGASINLMPLLIWEKLSLPKLTPTQMILELADRLTTRPAGIEIPEVIPFIESKEWIETKNELYKMMEAYTERMNQQREHEALLAAQREQKLLAQKQTAQEKEEPPQNSDFQLYCVHDSIKDLIGMAMNTMLLSINLKSQRLNKEKQEVKNIVEQETKRKTRITESLHNFTIIHKMSSISNTPQISSVIANTPDLPAKKLEYSPSMRDEHLSTISKTKSDEVIKSSVRNLVPIPSESEEADFDLEEEIRLVENLLYDNSSPRPMKELNAKIADTILESLSPSPIPVEDSDSHMEEIDLFLAMDDLMPPGIENDDYDSEGDIYFFEDLLSNDPLSLPKNESSNFDHHDDLTKPRHPLEPPDVEVFFDFEPDTGVLTTKVVKGISEHYVLMPNILPTFPTLDPNLDFTPSHNSFGSKNKIFDLRIFIKVQSERLLSIALDLEASRARGFVHRPFEFQSLAYGNPIS